MHIPKIIHQTWKDDNIPSYFRVLTDTWKIHHPTWKYVLWTDEMNRNFIHEKFPSFLNRYDNLTFNIQRADVIRYFILYSFGGVYVDLDFECIKPIIPLLENSSCVLGKEPKEHCLTHSRELIISNAFMACEPGHLFMKDLFEESFVEKISKSDVNDFILSSTGPFMISDLYENLKDSLNINLVDSEALYPLTKDEVYKSLQGENNEFISNKLERAYGVHYYWGSWWRSGIK